MPRIALAAFAIALATSGGAAAQVGPPAPPSLNLHTQTPAAECGTGSDHQVIVCGNRQRSPYRPDQTVLDAERSKEIASNPPRVQDRSGAANLCGTAGNECGGGVIPLLEPVLRVATAIVDAAKGDDWREAFRNGPSDYDRYQAAKQQKRGGVSIGVSSGNGDEALTRR